MVIIFLICLTATAVGLKTKSYKPWEIFLGVTTGLAFSATTLGGQAVQALAKLGNDLPGWLN